MIPSKIDIGQENLIKFLFEFDDVEYYSRLKYGNLDLEDLLRIIMDDFEEENFFLIDNHFEEATKKKLLDDTNLRENLFDAADNDKLYCLRKQKDRYLFFFEYGFNKASLFEDILYFFKKRKIKIVKISGSEELEEITGSLDPYLNY